MTRQPEGQGKGIQRKGGFGTDNKDLSVPKVIMNVRKAIHWVSAIPEGRVSQLVGELIKSGQPQTLSMALPMLESTTTAGIQMGMIQECGVAPLIQMSHGSIAMSKGVAQDWSVLKVIMNVRKVIHWVPPILEGQMSQLAEELG